MRAPAALNTNAAGAPKGRIVGPARYTGNRLGLVGKGNSARESSHFPFSSLRANAIRSCRAPDGRPTSVSRTVGTGCRGSTPRPSVFHSAPTANGCRCIVSPGCAFTNSYPTRRERRLWKSNGSCAMAAASRAVEPSSAMRAKIIAMRANL